MKKFDSFLVLDLFVAQKGTQKNMNALLPGTLPLVSAKKIDNGYRDFVEKDSGKVFEGHCLTLNNDGDGGAGLVFYQPSDFALDTHVTALYPKRDMSKLQMLYIANCISKQRSLFGHGRSINSSRLAHLTCMLPINEKSEPDYEFMEEYMKGIEKKLLKRYQKYLSKAKQTLPSINKLDWDSNIKWKDYEISNTFNIKASQSSIDKNKLTGALGNYPYITRSNLNNGIDMFIGEQPLYKLDNANTITIGLDTQTIFYQGAQFYTGQNIQVLSNLHLNKYVSLFIIPLIKTQLQKFNWGGNGATLGRLKKQRFILPINTNGVPNYAYMENYMKAKENEILNRYITKRLSNL